MVRPLKRDPTRTTALRFRLLKDMRRRFQKLIDSVVEFVEKEDAFGVGGVKRNVAKEYQFLTDDKKLTAFQRWLKKQIAAGVLQVEDHSQEPWLGPYIDSAYKQGNKRAYIDVNRDKYSSKERKFLDESFSMPVDTSRVKLLYMRAWEGMKGLTAQMETSMSRELASGLAHGKGPREIATKLKNTMEISKTRANTIARTEIIHSYAEGQLDQFDKLGVEELGVDVEWSDAGDDQVCPECEEMDGQLFSVDEARGKIPLHPNCRCAWIPAVNVTGKKEEAKKNSRKEQRMLRTDAGKRLVQSVLNSAKQGSTLSEVSISLQQSGITVSDSTIRNLLRAGKR